MNTPLIRRPDVTGASAEAVPAVPAATGAADGYPLPVTWRGIGAQAAGMASADAPLASGRRISGVFMTSFFFVFLVGQRVSWLVSGRDCRAATLWVSGRGKAGAAADTRRRSRHSRTRR